jgi:DNA-binding NtrC family response regulator
MDTQEVPIGVISFISQALCGAINEKLVRLGYKNIDTFEYNELFNAKRNRLNRVFVFPLSHGKSIQEKMRSAFELVKEKPVFGIVQASENDLNMDLLSCCNEFLRWPCPDNELAVRLERLCNTYRPILEQPCEEKILEEFIGLNMVGRSPAFLNVLKQINKIARCDTPVLIEGETGTGKELAARAIHYLSKRRDFPFIPANCGAIPDSLLENELFGHEKGAFTDAKSIQPGLISQSDRGTLFLDEVETFSMKGQVALLRFLEDQEYRPLGSSEPRRADVRVIAASNARLSNLVTQEKFRKDLFFRLNIISIKMPRLAKREGGIELLAEYFLNKYRLQYRQPEKYLHPDTMAWMKQYRWPGNVRELENMIHRAFLLAEGPAIKIKEIEPSTKERRKNLLDRRQKLFWDCNFNEAKARVISQFERRYLGWLIKETHGNVTMAAKRAGKERRALGKLLKKHAIAKDGSIKEPMA